jgi:hypothetical protein
MTIMQPSPAPGDGPREPRRLTLALAGGYAAGYSAALGLSADAASSHVSAGQTVVLTLAQGAVAAVCWVYVRSRKE